MSKIGLIILAIGVILAGCGKKEQVLSDVMQEPISMEALSVMNIEEAQTVPEQPVSVKTEAPAAEPELKPLPPSGPYKPTVKEIQTALKNADYYSGFVDGKEGPLTKKAIENFQKANDLKADGKVGIKTWSLLSKYSKKE